MENNTKAKLKSSTRKKDRINLTFDDMTKLTKKMEKGYRIIVCPKCHHVTRGKWIMEIVSCGCGYKKPEENGKQTDKKA